MVKKTQKIDLNSSASIRSLQGQVDEIKSLLEENLRYTKASSRGSDELKAQKELRQLLQENLEISKELQGMTKKIKRWVTMQRIWGILKILVILVPLALGAIYLPPLLQKVIQPYRELLDFNRGANEQGSILQIIEQSTDDETISE